MLACMTRDEAKQWLRLFGDLPDELRAPCIYDHPECSTSPQGMCLDDVLKIAFDA